MIAVLDGEMNYSINGERISIKEGEGVFVNSRQLHYGYSETQTEYVKLSGDIPWEETVLDLIRDMYCAKDDVTAPMMVQHDVPCLLFLRQNVLQ